MSTAIVVAVVAVLMLLGIGMVVNQLFRLRRWLNATPPAVPPGPPPAPPRRPPDEEVRRPPEPPV